MASNNTTEDPLGFRVVVAGVATVIFAYLVFLLLDVINGWGMGWIVLMWAGLAAAGVFALGVVISAWVWVYRGTGSYQVKAKNR